MTGGRSRKKPNQPDLQPDDAVLWQKVVDSVKPLKRSSLPKYVQRGRTSGSKNLAHSTAEFASDDPEKRMEENRDLMRAAMGLKKRPSAEMPITIAKSKPVFPQTKPFEPFLEPYRPPVSKPVAKHNQEPIDRKTRRQIAKGSVPINDRLDLHGMTQDEAYGALIGFVSRARSAGHRHVLVITGKGLSKQGQGVLRRMVPRWLKAAPLAQHVNGFEWASPGHGGDGALYIRLRRSLDGANGKAYRP